MQSADVINKERAISELSLFIRKVFAEPDICNVAKDIARKHLGQENALVLIADELSATTNVKIPVEHSEADTLFLELLVDIVRDETALY
ncbi:MAG: hypothetical protein ACPG4U_01955 [Pseudomonadales bacterium]